MNDFEYYFMLGCVLLIIFGLVGFCAYLYISRKHKDNVHLQEIAAFTFCNSLLIATIIFTLTTEILYKYYH